MRIFEYQENFRFARKYMPFGREKNISMLCVRDLLFTVYTIFSFYEICCSLDFPISHNSVVVSEMYFINLQRHLHRKKKTMSIINYRDMLVWILLKGFIYYKESINSFRLTSLLKTIIKCLNNGYPIVSKFMIIYN